MFANHFLPSFLITPISTHSQAITCVSAVDNRKRHIAWTPFKPDSWTAYSLMEQSSILLNPNVNPTGNPTGVEQSIAADPQPARAIDDNGRGVDGCIWTCQDVDATLEECLVVVKELRRWFGTSYRVLVCAQWVYQRGLQAALLGTLIFAWRNVYRGHGCEAAERQDELTNYPAVEFYGWHMTSKVFYDIRFCRSRGPAGVLLALFGGHGKPGRYSLLRLGTDDVHLVLFPEGLWSRPASAIYSDMAVAIRGRRYSPTVYGWSPFILIIVLRMKETLTVDLSSGNPRSAGLWAQGDSVTFVLRFGQSVNWTGMVIDLLGLAS
ncbi:uncharacterized protein BCR38DRAFT_508917 [Pseudomassariella vexata]|uniref:Uncharacterized protein n=1 Tax=Pseudomassariella vexata TaxID=1141098 RepID=A0A1Y2D6X1_9PEZI|nr:uncharacterized protein BCR38DRAFT_508917 [Pseudomassariella vexata]ORY54816.1 hypothetical protein BCR38DRAFT_508917 [Pseudomassariella vexata]